MLTTLAITLTALALLAVLATCFTRAERAPTRYGDVPWLDRDEEFWTDDGEYSVDEFDYEIGRDER